MGKCSLKTLLESGPVEMSAPCRVDFGGTLDISTFYFPLRHWNPATFNIALDMRTRVRLLPYSSGRVKVSSKGFDTAEFDSENLPFSHPLGLMFAIAAYYGAEGVHIDINSSSPPRSALGGSSVAAVGLVAAFIKAFGLGDPMQLRDRIVLLAHAIESSVARIPCGIQDQLAAAYGGVHLWQWNGQADTLPYSKIRVVETSGHRDLEKHFIAAYCGEPHESMNINNKWVDNLLQGGSISRWKEIVRCCNAFSEAVSQGNYHEAAELMSCNDKGKDFI